MKINKTKPVLLLVVIYFVSITANFAGNKNMEIQSGSNSNSNTFYFPTAAENHDPILIDGDAALASFIANEGLSGDGTFGTPYVIEDFTLHGFGGEFFQLLWPSFMGFQ
ncbi:MAG: hypothetical protein ACTSRK_17935 [Promethearchaeota archaeon]